MLLGKRNSLFFSLFVKDGRKAAEGLWRGPFAVRALRSSAGHVEAAGSGEANFLLGGQDARGMAGRRPLLNRCARPARPASLTHSLRRVDAQPDPERLAPATVLTLRRTPHACAGRYLGRSWAPTTPPAARCRCPPLSSRLLPRDTSAGSRRPPQAPAAFRFEPARRAGLLWHPLHPWEGVPSCVGALSGSVHRERTNCHMCCLYKA